MQLVVFRDNVPIWSDSVGVFAVGLILSLWSQGESGDCMYIVEEGQFEVLKPEVGPSSVILSKAFAKLVLGWFEQYLFKTACVRTLLPPVERNLLLLLGVQVSRLLPVLWWPQGFFLQSASAFPHAGSSVALLVPQLTVYVQQSGLSRCRSTVLKNCSTYKHQRQSSEVHV